MADASYLPVNTKPGSSSLKHRRLKFPLVSPTAGRGAPPAGAGYLAGKLTGADPLLPASIRILYRHANQGSLGDGYLVAVTTPNAVGEWRVENLNPALKFDVVARREGFNDVITAGVSPLPL